MDLIEKCAQYCDKAAISYELLYPSKIGTICAIAGIVVVTVIVCILIWPEQWERNKNNYFAKGRYRIKYTLITLILLASLALSGYIVFFTAAKPTKMRITCSDEQFFELYQAGFPVENTDVRSEYIYSPYS